MLDPDVVETGVGIEQSSNTGRWYGVQMFGRPESARISFQIVNSADAAVTYRVGAAVFDLPPGNTRTHEQCRPAEMTVDWPDEQPPTSVAPQDGDRYTIAHPGSGHWHVERG
jgi:hypothetical protein